MGEVTIEGVFDSTVISGHLIGGGSFSIFLGSTTDPLGSVALLTDLPPELEFVFGFTESSRDETAHSDQQSG